MNGTKTREVKILKYCFISGFWYCRVAPALDTCFEDEYKVIHVGKQ